MRASTESASANRENEWKRERERETSGLFTNNGIKDFIAWCSRQHIDLLARKGVSSIFHRTTNREHFFSSLVSQFSRFYRVEIKNVCNLLAFVIWLQRTLTKGNWFEVSQFRITLFIKKLTGKISDRGWETCFDITILARSNMPRVLYAYNIFEISWILQRDTAK